MNRHAAIELAWADGDYTFRLGLTEIEELEDKCNLGIFQIFQSVGEGRTFRLKHVSETIRLGLIGGETSPPEALRLARKYVDERPIEENRDVAFSIVMAALGRVYGDELIKQAEGGTDDAGKSRDSTSPASTEAEVSSDSHPMKSEK
ncbi:MAG: gene transfer agent family protein [Rhodobacteraceae bacterium]|nr:gene transfer agent family protein [Paracoccaceae bacterium]